LPQIKIAVLTALFVFRFNCYIRATERHIRSIQYNFPHTSSSKVAHLYNCTVAISLIVILATNNLLSGNRQ